MAHRPGWEDIGGSSGSPPPLAGSGDATGRSQRRRQNHRFFGSGGCALTMRLNHGSSRTGTTTRRPVFGSDGRFVRRRGAARGDAAGPRQSGLESSDEGSWRWGEAAGRRPGGFGSSDTNLPRWKKERGLGQGNPTCRPTGNAIGRRLQPRGEGRRDPDEAVEFQRGRGESSDNLRLRTNEAVEDGRKRSDQRGCG